MYFSSAFPVFEEAQIIAEKKVEIHPEETKIVEWKRHVLQS